MPTTIVDEFLEFCAQLGVPNPCESDARLLGDSSEFVSHSGWVCLYESVPTDWPGRCSWIAVSAARRPSSSEASTSPTRLRN